MTMYLSVAEYVKEAFIISLARMRSNLGYIIKPNMGHGWSMVSFCFNGTFNIGNSNLFSNITPRGK